MYYRSGLARCVLIHGVDVLHVTTHGSVDVEEMTSSVG